MTIVHPFVVLETLSASVVVGFPCWSFLFVGVIKESFMLDL